MCFEINACVVCGNPIEGGVLVTQANRRAKGKGGHAYVCHSCAEAEAKRSARNKAVRGKANEAELEYRLTIHCEYSLEAKAEFVKSKWLACEGNLKSPKYRNMKWQRKLETLDHLIETGDIVLTRDMAVSVIRDGDVLECTQVAYTGKAEFLDFVRHLVGKHKADIYLAKYGKTFGYENN